jgi:hypothetical protein
MASSTGENLEEQDMLAECNQGIADETRRIRTLTDKADDNYQQTVTSYRTDLDKSWNNILHSNRDMASIQRDEQALSVFRSVLVRKFQRYETVSNRYHKFLTDTRTVESLWERDMYAEICRANDLIMKSKLVCWRH